MSPTSRTRSSCCVIFEAARQVRRAISVMKKRTSACMKTRSVEYRIGSRGIVLGEPLVGFQGVLPMPELVGTHTSLLEGGKRGEGHHAIRAGTHSRATRARCADCCGDPSGSWSARSALRQPSRADRTSLTPAPPL